MQACPSLQPTQQTWQVQPHRSVLRHWEKVRVRFAVAALWLPRWLASRPQELPKITVSNVHSLLDLALTCCQVVAFGVQVVAPA